MSEKYPKKHTKISLEAKYLGTQKIDYEKCVTCGKCVDFCHTNAFRTEEKDGEKRTLVNPNRCVVFCRGCEDICPASAITHPSEEETQKIIDKIKEDKT